MKRLVYGHGINDADYQTSFRVEGKERKCPFYVKWVEMLKHCYCPKYQAKFETYKKVVLCDDWHYFMSFKSWMETQDWVGRDLDKDLLTDTAVYSPETCMLIPHTLNCFMTKSNKTRGAYPIGVSYYKKYSNYASKISFNGKRKFLGYFDTAEEAHKAWQHSKLEVINTLKSKYFAEERICQGLDRVYKCIYEDIKENRETKDF